MDKIVLRRAARQLRAAIVDLLLPGSCEGCGEPGTGLCPQCRAHLHRRSIPSCMRCGEALVAGVPCRASHRRLAGLAFARAPFLYVGTGGALVRRLKFAAEFGAVRLLAAAMAGALAADLSGSFRRALLVPVPLHRRRRRARGFDQARLLAESIGPRLGLDVVLALRRARSTLPQGDPRVTSRERNVEGAFVVGRPRQVRDRAIVLVDDVATSLATARGCARVLLSAGARRVGLVTACRA